MRRIPVDAAFVRDPHRDGGQSFEVLCTGLPQQHCYDLIYRHGLAVDETGTQLMMGSDDRRRLGQLDAGDSWQTVSTTLPPVYAVKLG